MAATTKKDNLKRAPDKDAVCRGCGLRMIYAPGVEFEQTPELSGDGDSAVDVNNALVSAAEALQKEAKITLAVDGTLRGYCVTCTSDPGTRSVNYCVCCETSKDKAEPGWKVFDDATDSEAFICDDCASNNNGKDFVDILEAVKTVFGVSGSLDKLDGIDIHRYNPKVKKK